MLRSQLTITPSDSVHNAAGSKTFAYSLVSVSKNASWLITNSAFSKPARTVLRLATVATGLLQMIQHALISPSAMRENMSMTPPLTSVRSAPPGRPHCSSTNSRSGADNTERCPGRPGPM